MNLHANTLPECHHHSERERTQAVVKSLFMPVRIGVVFTGLFYDEAKWLPIEAQICFCFLHKERTSATQRPRLWPAARPCGHQSMRDCAASGPAGRPNGPAKPRCNPSGVGAVAQWWWWPVQTLAGRLWRGHSCPSVV